MNEQNTTDSTNEKNTPSLESENERASAATKLTIGLAAVAVIVVVGVVVSLVMVFRGDDAEPLVSLEPTTGALPPLRSRTDSSNRNPSSTKPTASSTYRSNPPTG